MKMKKKKSKKITKNRINLASAKLAVSASPDFILSAQMTQVARCETGSGEKAGPQEKKKTTHQKRTNHYRL